MKNERMKMNVQKPEYETENENRLKVHKNRRQYFTYLCIEIRKRLCYSVTTINVAKKQEMKRFKRTAQSNSFQQNKQQKKTGG